MKSASANRVFIGKIEKWSRSGTSFSHTQGEKGTQSLCSPISMSQVGSTGPGGTLGVSNGRRQCL